MKIFASFMMAVILLWASGFGIFSWHIFTMKVAAPEQHTDAIVVLTGGPHRIETGLDLLHQNLSDELFISGVDRRVTIEKILEMWNKDAAPDICCITLGHEAHNTVQNAREFKKWSAGQDIKSLRLVTAAAHLPRALVEFRRALPGVTILPHPAAANGTKLWLAFSEYHKLILTTLKILPES